MSEFLKGVQQGAAIAQLRHQIQSEKDKILEMIADRLQTQRYRDAQLQQEQAYNTERLQTQKSYYDALGDQRMKEFEMTKLRGQREEDERMNKSNRAGLVSSIDAELLSDPAFASKPRAEREAIRADRLRVAGLTEEGDESLGIAAKFDEGKGKETSKPIEFSKVTLDGVDHNVPVPLVAKFKALKRLEGITDEAQRIAEANRLKAREGNWPTTQAEYEVQENELLSGMGGGGKGGDTELTREQLKAQLSRGQESRTPVSTGETIEDQGPPLPAEMDAEGIVIEEPEKGPRKRGWYETEATQETDARAKAVVLIESGNDGEAMKLLVSELGKEKALSVFKELQKKLIPKMANRSAEQAAKQFYSERFGR